MCGYLEKYWRFAAENPGKWNAQQGFVYLFFCRIGEQLGRNEFGYEPEFACAKLEISYKTLVKHLDELHAHGLVSIIQRGTNAAQRWVFALEEFTKAPSKAVPNQLTKHLPKHLPKQGESTFQSTGNGGGLIGGGVFSEFSVVEKTEEEKEKKTTREKKQKQPQEAPAELNIPFETFWQAYKKSDGKTVAARQWVKLTDAERQAAFDYLTTYLKKTPDKKFRKHASTYLNQKTWLDGPEAETPLASSAAPSVAAPSSNPKDPNYTLLKEMYYLNLWGRLDFDFLLRTNQITPERVQLLKPLMPLLPGFKP